jgi:hypothetical protein
MGHVIKQILEAPQPRRRKHPQQGRYRALKGEGPRLQVQQVHARIDRSAILEDSPVQNIEPRAIPGFFRRQQPATAIDFMNHVAPGLLLLLLDLPIHHRAGR